MQVSPQLYRWMVMSSSDGLWIMDPVGTVEFANPRMAEILGRPLDEVVGMSAFDMYDDVGRRDFSAHLTRLESAETGLDHLEVLVVRPDGTQVWTSTSFFPLVDDAGTRVGWVHRMTEFTALRDLQEKLRLSEARLSEAQRLTMVGSWEWDLASHTVTASEELYRIYALGLDRGPAAFEDYFEFVHPEDRTRATGLIAAALAGTGEASFDLRVRHGDGAERWVHSRGLVERDGSGVPVRMIGTAQDVTDAKRGEAATARAAARYHMLQTMSAAANEAVSLEDAVVVGAHELAEVAGWAHEAAFLVDSTGGLRELGRAGSPPLGAEVIRVGAGPEPAGAAVSALVRRAEQSGFSEVARIDDVESRVAIPVLFGGEAVCVVVFRGDLSGSDPQTLSVVEQGLAQLGRVAERERQAAHLAAARDEAMEASRLKSEFLSTMSHEIRTPMNGVIGLTDLLRRTELDPQQSKLVAGLQETGQTLLSLINDILDLSKIEAGRLELELVDFEIREVVDRTAALLAESARSKGLTLVVGCHPDVPRTVHGDPGRLAQVLANLGSNAVKFTDAGEVVIHVDPVPGAAGPGAADRTDAETRTDEVVLRVEVADTGVGIPARDRDRLFDPFVQADPSTTRRHGGTGLGLAISKRLVAAMGGEIGVRGEVGVGSVFWFTTSLGAVPASEPWGRPTPVRGDDRTDRRALVVVAHPAVAALLVEQLGGHRIIATSVASVPAAVRELGAADTTYELALVEDTLWPDLDVQLAEEPRADRPQVVVLTSASGSAPVPGRPELGVVATLGTPVRHAELDATLRRVLDPAVVAVPAEALDDLPAPRGQTILVAEDNQVNQIVAAGLLELLGYAVDLVGDGVAAVAAVTGSHPYAAVLMDCRMPRMDGYAAARAIRAQEPQGTHLPIIALTASAVEDERERCFGAGMDDFVAKPVQLGRLGDALARWVPAVDRRGPRSLPPALEPSAATARATAPWATAVRLDEGRRALLASVVSDGINLFDRAAALFVADVPQLVDALTAAVDTADASALEATAHKLKGGAENLGLTRVAIIARLLEEQGERGRPAGAAIWVAALRTELDAALDELGRSSSALSGAG